jgi:hypothetical protein
MGCSNKEGTFRRVVVINERTEMRITRIL